MLCVAVVTVLAIIVTCVGCTVGVVAVWFFCKPCKVPASAIPENKYRHGRNDTENPHIQADDIVKVEGSMVMQKQDIVDCIASLQLQLQLQLLSTRVPLPSN